MLFVHLEINHNLVGYSHEVIKKIGSANLPLLKGNRKETRWFSLPIRARLSPRPPAIYSVWCYANSRSELSIFSNISANWFQIFRVLASSHKTDNKWRCRARNKYQKALGAGWKGKLRETWMHVDETRPL